MFDAKELLNVLTGGNPGPRAEAAAAAANDALERGKQVATDAANQTAAAVSSALGKAQEDFRALKLRLTSARRRKSLARTQLEPPRPWVGSRPFFLALRAAERSPAAPSSWAASPPSAAWPIRRSGTIRRDARSPQACRALSN